MAGNVKFRAQILGQGARFDWFLPRFCRSMPWSSRSADRSRTRGNHYFCAMGWHFWFIDLPGKRG